MNFIVFITFMQELKFFIGMLYMTNFFFDIQRYIGIHTYIMIPMQTF